MRYGGPMELAEHEIERFIRAWKKDFGETLSKDAARSELSRLLTFLRILASATSVDRTSSSDSAGRDTMAP